jgi:hypothetical protein
MRRRGVLKKPFFLGDRYAAIALGSHHETRGSFADLDIHVSARGLSNTVIPEIDEEVLTVVGDVDEQVAAVRDVLLSRWTRRELWNQPTLPMELQSYVAQLLEQGEVFIHLLFEQGKSGDYSLFKTRWLAPETIVVRRGRATTYEQFVSWRAYTGSGYSVAGDPTDHFAEFQEDEILHLRWPLDEPGGSRGPATAALRLGKRIAVAANRGILRARAGAEPEETYWSIARARGGAYNDALDVQKALSARAKDLLFYPGADEAEVFPWADSITDFFLADRILRSRSAIAQIRDYLFAEFNRQVIGTWVRLNGWSEIRLVLRPQLFTVEDWRAMRAQLRSGEIDLEDVRAAVRSEAEAARALNSRWNA